MLTNGNFESSSNGWTLSSRASVLTDNTTNMGGNIYKPTLGTNALQITGSSTGLGYATQVCNIDRVDGDEKNVYTLGAWLKTNGSIAKDNRTVSIIIKNHTTEGVGETITSITYDNSISDWQYMMVSFNFFS